MSPGDYAAIAAILLTLLAVSCYVAARTSNPTYEDSEFQELEWKPGVPEEDGDYWMRNPLIGNEIWPCKVSHGVPDCHLAETDGVMWAERNEPS